MLEFGLFKVGFELREYPRSYIHDLRKAWRKEVKTPRMFVWDKAEWVYQYQCDNPIPASDATYATFFVGIPTTSTDEF